MPIERIEDMPIVRVFFAKTGPAKYTSHLDTMRAITRALRRSGLPVWHTQGFNPHLYLNFALPIALGYEGACEPVDMRLTEATPFEDVKSRLNAALPPGFSVVRAAAPALPPSAIAWADYDVRLVFTDADTDDLLGRFRVMMEQPVLEVEKKTKKGIGSVDLKPHAIVLLAEAQGDALVFKLRMAAGLTLNMNPTLLLKAFYKWIGTCPDGVRIVRTGLLTADFGQFS